MAFEPTGHLIAVLRDVAPHTTPEGLHIPATHRPRRQTGVVRFTGPKVQDLQPGDRIILPEREGIPVREGGEVLEIFSGTEIVAKVGG